MAETEKKRRDRGDDGISWDITNKCYVGTISLGIDASGKRVRRTVTGKTKVQVKNKLDTLHDEIKAGVRSPATYTVEQCIRDWLDSLTINDETIAQYRGQAEKWIYPKIGSARLKQLSAKDVERFFNDCGRVLSKRSLVGLKSTLRRSIRRAQRHDLIGRNVADLVDLPEGQPGRPSRAMTEQQAVKVLGAATGKPIGYVTVVKVGNYRQAAAHAATEAGQLACGTKPRKNATIQHLSTDLADTTCHHCRNQLGLDGTQASDGRLEALFVLTITLGLRPGELRALTWDRVNLDQGIIHVWRSARKGVTPKHPSPGARSCSPSEP